MYIWHSVSKRMYDDWRIKCVESKVATACFIQCIRYLIRCCRSYL